MSSLRSALAAQAVFLTAIVSLGFAIRIIVVACLLSHETTRTVNYNDFGWESWEMGWVARSIVLGQGFSSPFLPVTGPTALVPPLYPYLLAGIFHVFGLNTVKVTFAVLGFNSVCSALTCLPLYFLVKHSLNRSAARLVALAWAVYPFAVYFSADRVWDYAVTGLLFTCTLLLAQRLPRLGIWGWVGFGALYGLAVLSNPSVIMMLPILLVTAALAVRRAGGAWLMQSAAALLMFVLICTPWTIRNTRVMHSNFFIRDGFWLEFYAGNNGDTHESNCSWAHPASNPDELARYQREGEIRYMGEKRALSIDFVKHHPGFFAVATARRIVRFWTGYWSFRPEYLKFEPFDLPNVPFCIFLLFFMVRGLRRWMRENARTAVPYLLAVLIFPLPYYITHSSMDYRQPIEPIVVLLVCVGLFGTRAAAGRCEDPAEEETLSESDAVLV
jgi:4-amino-4-deoxy-L-arabinose transferase-like glycosyltransferase